MNGSKRALLILVAVCVGVIARASEESPQASFPLRLPVDGVWTAKAICRVDVPLSVFDRSPSFPAGIRLYTPDGTACPYFIHVPEPRETTVSLPVRTLNRSEVAGPARYTRIDLAIEATASGTKREHDRVVITMPGGRHFRLVELFGSEDQQTWASIGAGYLVSDGGGLHNHVITYPTSTYPHIQVRIHPDARSAAEALDIGTILVQGSTRETGEAAVVAMKFKAGKPEEGDPAGTQMIEADLGYRHVPVARLRFDVDGGDFARAVSLYGRNADTSDWQFVNSASLFRIGKTEGRTLDAGGRAFRYWRIRIANNDDLPLHVGAVDAERVPRQIIFESPVAGERAWLHFGSDEVGASSYDLERRLDRPAIGAATLAHAGPEEANPAFKVSGFRYEQLAVRVLVGLASLVVLAVIASMLRKPHTAARDGKTQGTDSAE